MEASATRENGNYEIGKFRTGFCEKCIFLSIFSFFLSVQFGSLCEQSRTMPGLNPWSRQRPLPSRRKAWETVGISNESEPLNALRGPERLYIVVRR